MAFLIPAALVLLCLVKKLTVIGIIGKTQGVSKAAKPEKKAIKKIDHNPISSVGFDCSTTFFSANAAIFSTLSISFCASSITFFVFSISLFAISISGEFVFELPTEIV